MRAYLQATFLLFCILTYEVQGTRLKKEFVSIGHFEIHIGYASATEDDDAGGAEAIDCNDGQCSGTTKGRLSRARGEFHQPLPEIHEDYYGPRSHNPKHH